MRYSVSIENLDGTGRITLSVGEDAEAAAELAAALVRAASGASFSLDVQVEHGGSPVSATTRHEAKAGAVPPGTRASR